MKDVIVGLHIHGMPGVRTTHSNYVLVLLGEVGRNLPFAFATKLPAYEHIYKRPIFTTVEADVGSRADQNVICRATVRIYDYICNGCQALNFALRRILLYIAVRLQLFDSTLFRFNSLAIALREDIIRCRHMDMYDSVTVATPDGINLPLESHSIH